MFNIDFDKIVQLLLPLLVRKEKMLAFVVALIKPIKTIYAELQSLRSLTINYTTHTGQVIYLEHILNETFYPDYAVNNRIHIIDSDDLRNNDILYNVSEGQEPIYLSNAIEAETPLYVANKTEYDMNTDFVVRAPVSTESPYENQMLAMVNKYRQAGKRFEIEYFDPNT